MYQRLWERQFEVPGVVEKTISGTRGCVKDSFRYQRLWERQLKAPEAVGKTA